MIVNKLEPQGYCGGVTRAIKMAYDLAKKTNEPIYMLGKIIHNQHVIDNLESIGIKTIDDKNKTRLELLDSIENGIVIFSAHGVAKAVYQKAKDKGLKIVDASCPYVLIVHDRIEEHLEKGYTCIYIGTKGHPECEGVIGISSSIIFVKTKEDILNLDPNLDKVYVTNQTTLAINETKELFDLIKEKYKNAIIDDKICNATTVRQEAVLNQPKADLCIVVGDKNSSNTNKLKEVSLKTGTKTILIDSLETLDKSILKNINVVNITSGASTPSYIVDEIIDYLNKM